MAVAAAAGARRAIMQRRRSSLPKIKSSSARSWRKSSSKVKKSKNASSLRAAFRSGGGPPKRTSTGFLLRTAAHKLRFTNEAAHLMHHDAEQKQLKRPKSFRGQKPTPLAREHTASKVMQRPGVDGDESASASPSILNKQLFVKADPIESQSTSSLSLSTRRRRLSTARVAMLSVLLKKVSSEQSGKSSARDLRRDVSMALTIPETGHEEDEEHGRLYKHQSNFKALKLRASISRTASTSSTRSKTVKSPLSGLDSCRKKLEENVVETAWFANVITALVFLNALVMMFDIDYCWYYRQGYAWKHNIPYSSALRYEVPCNVNDPNENIFIVVDWIFSLIFTIEIIITGIALGPRFALDKWHVFDTILVVIADVEFIAYWVVNSDQTDSENAGVLVVVKILSVVKLLRVLRIFRLVVVHEELRLLMRAAGRSLQSLVVIAVASLMLFFVFAIFTTRLWGCKAFSPEQLDMLDKTFSNDPGGQFEYGLLDDEVDFASAPERCDGHAEEFRRWFGNIPRSMYTLFQIMTLESWSMGIVRVVMDSWWYSSIFFIIFVFISTFVIINLLASEFVSKLLEVKEEHLDTDRLSKLELQKVFQAKLEKHFDQMDTDGDEVISLLDLEKGVQNSPGLKRLLLETGWITEDLESVRHMFDIMDVNGSGSVGYDEFIQIADIFGQEIQKEHVFKAHSNLVRRLKQLENLIDSVRDTALPLIPNTKHEAQMVQRTVERMLKDCDASLLKQISLSSPTKRVREDAIAVLSEDGSEKGTSSPEIDRSRLIKVISKHAQRTVLWWMTDHDT